MLEGFDRQCLQGAVSQPVADAALLARAAQLEHDHLVTLRKTDDGFYVQPNLEGMNQWLQKLLCQFETELGVRFVNVEPLLYLIHHPNNRPFSSFVGGQTRTLLSAEVLWVALESHPKQISFVDIYEDPSVMAEALGCKPRLILEENEQGFFLNQRLILGRRSHLRCCLLRFLCQQKHGDFITYEELARHAESVIQQPIQDLKKGVYYPLYSIQHHVQKSLNIDLFKFHDGSVRLSRGVRVSPTSFEQ